MISATEIENHTRVEEIELRHQLDNEGAVYTRMRTHWLEPMVAKQIEILRAHGYLDIDLAENISTKQETPMPVYERKWHNFANGHAEYTRWERISEADVKKALSRSKRNTGQVLDDLERGYEVKLPLFSLRIKPRDLP